MRKHAIKAACLLALVAVFLLGTVALAAAPGQPESSAQAAPTVSVETETIVQGEALSVRVSLPAGAAAAKAAVETVGLQFVNATGGLSTKDNLALMDTVPTAVYNFRVLAGPQQRVAFALSGVSVLPAADGTEQPAPDVFWSDVVSGKAPRPTADPSPSSAPLPSSRPQGPLTIPGTADVSVSGDLITGRTVRVTISTTADGIEAQLQTKGLQFEGVDSTFCDASRVILVNSGTVARATYTYLVTARDGEEVSIDVTNVTISQDGADVPGTPTAWINWVGSGSSQQPAASGTPTRDPGSHPFTVSGGLSLTALQSGRTVVTGLTAGRYGRTVQDFLSRVNVPGGGHAELVDPLSTVLSGSQVVMSGCELRIFNSAGRLIDQAVIALRGDVLQKGVADLSQVVQVARYLNTSREPTELQAFCADMNRNGRVDVTDLVAMASLLQ
ncbi:MAG: hypothetical protein HDQ87_12065 [Clostridia bacterium]|nr:hypothetical protein [Clostridia bacterium]